MKGIHITLSCWWGETDSNHRSEAQQIYSLPPLATREPPQKDGAGDGTRTRDLLITNQLLYQLSYTSTLLFFLFSFVTSSATEMIITQKNNFVNTFLNIFLIIYYFFIKKKLFSHFHIFAIENKVYFML